MKTYKKYTWALFFAIYLLCFLPYSYGQKKKKTHAQAESISQNPIHTSLMPFLMDAYKQSLKYGDANSAISFLYLALAYDSTQTHLKDSIATLYFLSRRFYEAVNIGEDILKNNPDNQNILEIVARSYQALGNLREALTKYERLYSLTKNIYHLYQVASLQYQLDRFTECRLTLTQLINDPQSEQTPINIFMENGGQVQVPTKAAAYNLLGALFLKLKEYDEAEQAFQQALAIKQDFELPRQNLEFVKKMRQENKN